MDIEKSRTLMNDYLERIFVARTEKADSIHERYRLLWDRIERLSFCGGKRIRPVLTLMSANLFKEDVSEFVKTAVALEIFQFNFV